MNIQEFPLFQLKLLLEFLLAPVIILIPRDRRKVIFGAWKGKQFACNPRYLCEYVAKRGGFKCVWIGNKELESRVREVPGVIFAPKGSFRALWHALTGWTYVFNINWEDDIVRFPRYGRVNLLYVCHGYADKVGVGSKKRSSPQVVRAPKRLQWLRDLQWKLWGVLYKKDSWCSECSELAIEKRLGGHIVEFDPDRMLRHGYPRSDYFFNNGHSEEEKNKYRIKYSKILRLPLDKKWYLFVPTWRHNASGLVSLTKMTRSRELDEVLTKNNAIIIEKQHPIVLETMLFQTCSTANVHVINKEESHTLVLQELLMACDRMITDVSSVFFDFYLMERPVIHYVYDFEHFMNEEFGLIYDIRRYRAGPLAYNEEELIKCVGETDEELLAQRNPETRDYLLTYVHGDACAHYYELLERLAKTRRYFVPKNPRQM